MELARLDVVDTVVRGLFVVVVVGNVCHRREDPTTNNSIYLSPTIHSTMSMMNTNSTIC